MGNIYIKDWLEMKPYTKQVNTDFYYLKLCNKVRAVMSAIPFDLVLEKVLPSKEIDKMAIFLTSYFEDLVSETNIFSNFTRLNERIYNKSLPFFDLDDYYEGEVNVQDIQFLIWYFLNTSKEDWFFSPYNKFIEPLSTIIAEIFYDHWEDAPENEHLLQYYYLDDEEDDYYAVRRLMDNILYKTWLFQTDIGRSWENIEGEILKKDRENIDPMSLLNDMRDKLIHSRCSKLLALSAKEWAAEILGPSHPRYRNILDLSPKLQGFFLYKGQDSTHVLLEHIASRRKFRLLKKSYDYAKELSSIDDILMIGMVKWKQEWWFSGVAGKYPYSEKIVSAERNSVDSIKNVSFLDRNSHEAKELLAQQGEVFLAVNNNSPIVFLDREQVNEYLIRLQNGYIELMKNKKGEEWNAKNLPMDVEPTSINNSSEHQRNDDASLIFFNPNSGYEIAFGVNSAFPLPNNPFYEESLAEAHTNVLMMDDSCSVELVRFCFDNCKIDRKFFQREKGEVLYENLDFLLRFWKKENYHTKPSVTLTSLQDRNF